MKILQKFILWWVICFSFLLTFIHNLFGTSIRDMSFQYSRNNSMKFGIPYFCIQFDLFVFTTHLKLNILNVMY